MWQQELQSKTPRAQVSDPGWISHGFEVDQEEEIGEKYEITKNSEELVYMVYVCKGIAVLIITNIWLNS